MPMTSKVSSKGQVTLPKAIRNLLELEEGNRVKFIVEDDKINIVKIKQIVVDSSISEKLNK